MTLICILVWRVLYSVFCELLKGEGKKKKDKTPDKYWILLSHIMSAL